MKIAVVATAFNEAKRIRAVLSDISDSKLPAYVVDDGSNDPTSDSARGFKNVRVLRHAINLGKGAALKTGCLAAFKDGFEAVILMDSDGQHDAADIGKFTAKLNAGYDIVYGTRDYGLGVPLIRFLGNKFASVFINLLFGIYISDLICGYRALTRRAFTKIDWESTGYGVETEMVIKTAKNHLKYCEVMVENLYHDKYKGVTIVDALGVFFQVIGWRLKI